MIGRRTAVLLAAGLLAPLVLTSAPAGAALEQDLVASVTAGPPGTVVTLSSATCVAGGDDEAYLDLVAYSGTAPSEKLAGFGSGTEGSATITIPDWVDPDQPLSIEGECYQYSNELGGHDSITYDPIAFDVEPGGGGTPVQVPTFSRTSLLSGQSTLVTGNGCPTNSLSAVTAMSGTDLSGREGSGDEAGFAYAPATSGSFEAELAMTNGSVVINIDGSEDDTTITSSEEPNTLPLGPYAVFAYCVTDDMSGLMLEPSLIELTGNAPTDGIDLTVADGTPDVTLAGECAAGDVTGDLEGESIEQITGEIFDPPASMGDARSFARSPLPGSGDASDTSDGSTRIRAGGDRGSATARVGGNGDATEFSVTPDGAGAWSLADSAEFDEGFVLGFARCGDPLGDGYYYDPQAVDIDVVPEPPVVPSTVPATVPPAAPANAVKGTPTYAG